MSPSPPRSARVVLRALLAPLVMLALALLSSPARARDLVDEPDFGLSLRSAFKSSLLLAFPPDDPVLFPDRTSGAALLRLRFELGARLGDHLRAAVAYEHRVRATSASSIGAGILPSSSAVAFRLDPLSSTIVDAQPGYEHVHELDRAWLALHLDFLELTVGRQAIGLGSGVLFGAVDVFSPFSPTEVDREWRRGVDAAHLALHVPDLPALSADVYVALGQAQASGGVASYAAIGRLRAVVGELDGSLILGRRGDDDLVGGTLSATIGDVEVHGELALYGTDGRGVDGGFLGTRGVVAKGLLGTTFDVPVGAGLHVVAEYHHSGFGVNDIATRPDVLFDPFFQARLARGDTQILGRHALALALSYDVVPELSATLSGIVSPVDGSGLLAAAATWSQSDAMTLVLDVFVPWGLGPDHGVPRSEWGLTPITIFVQARFYD